MIVSHEIITVRPRYKRLRRMPALYRHYRRLGIARLASLRLLWTVLMFKPNSSNL